MNMISPDAIDQLIRDRRSVFPKEYNGTRVEDATVRQILENANWAPTHKLTEPWRFVVFTGTGLSKLADLQATCYKKVTEADGTFKDDKYQSLLTKPKLSSHIIVVGMKRDEKSTVPEVEEIGAVFCAIQNMYLTATAYGVGAYLSTGGITYFHEAKELFGLGANDKLIGFFHLGMSSTPLLKGKRKPVGEKITWVDQ
jgi:nitroreductase